MGEEQPQRVCALHYSVCMIGGFMGGYAVVSYGTLASAQTNNLLLLTIDLLQGGWVDVLLRLGVLGLYMLGTALTVIIPRKTKLDVRAAALGVDALAAVLLGFFPPNIYPLLALYPIFFSMAFQWNSFPGAYGFASSTIFSTNNVRQTAISLTEYRLSGGAQHLFRARFFALVLLTYHIGTAISCCAFWLLGGRGAWVCLVLVLHAAYRLLRARESRAGAKASV